MAFSTKQEKGKKSPTTSNIMHEKGMGKQFEQTLYALHTFFGKTLLFSLPSNQRRP